MSPFDLHVLSTPPAFILSQDQTLMLKYDLLRSSLTAKSFVWFLHQLNWLIHPLHFWCDCIKMLLLFKGFVLWTFYIRIFYRRISLLEFSGLHYCLFVKVLVLFAWRNSDILSSFKVFVKNFFIFFKHFLLLVRRFLRRVSCYHTFKSVSTLFSFIFQIIFWFVYTIQLRRKKRILILLRYFSHGFFAINRIYFENKWNGEEGIWTLAPVTWPTPLAGAPLQPLEYFSLGTELIPLPILNCASSHSTHDSLYISPNALSTPFFKLI